MFEDVYFQRNLVCFPITDLLGLLGVEILYALIMAWVGLGWVGLGWVVTGPAGIYTNLTSFTFQDAIMDFVKEIFLF